VKQANIQTIGKLGEWVKSIGSQFHSLPLLNLVDQRDMIMKAFEDETVEEVERLLGEVAAILKDPNRSIAERIYDQYADKVAELNGKVAEYDAMLGSRAQRATMEIAAFKLQVMQLAPRIRETRTFKAKSGVR